MNAIDRAAKVTKATERMRSVDVTYMPVYPGGQKQFDEDCQVLAIEFMARHAAAELVLAADPAERADQWLDIATAPKDGTPILLRDGSIVGSGQYGRTEPWSMRKLDGFYFDGASLPSLATHWCHLPLPPPEVTDDQA